MRVTPGWWRVLSYVLLAYFLLWIWQDIVDFKAVHTLPYSEFKHYLALGQVTQCEIEQDDIQGKIDPTRAIKAAGKATTSG